MDVVRFPLQTSALGKALLFAPSIFVVLLLSADPYLGAMLLAFYVPLLVLFLRIREAYELTDQVLRFRQGRLTAWSIPLGSIVRAGPHAGSTSLAAGPLQGVKIDFGRTSKVVFVADAQAFLLELAARSPHLRTYGVELRSPQAALA